MPEKNCCFNCDSEPYKLMFCRECWRMLILASVGMESLHKLITQALGL